MIKITKITSSLSLSILSSLVFACGQNQTNVPTTENVFSSTSTTVPVSNPYNKLTKKVYIHLNPENKKNDSKASGEEADSKPFGTKASGEEADSNQLILENLDNGDTVSDIFEKNSIVVLGSLILGNRYKITSNALLNGEVIATAETIITVTPDLNDIYLNYVSTPSPAVETIDTILPLNPVYDTRVPATTPTPTLSLATSSLTPTLSAAVTVTNNGGQLPKVARDGNNIYIANTSVITRNPEVNKSTDNGNTYTKLTLPTTGQVMNGTEFDINATNGVLRYAYISSNKLFVITSTDAGQTWSTPTSLSNDFTWADNPNVYVYNDEPYILFRGYKNNKIELHVVKSSGEVIQVTNNSVQEENGKLVVNDNGIYVAYIDMYNTLNSYLTNSTDGFTFTSPIQINKTYGKSGGHDIATNSNGDLFIAYSDTTTDYEGDLYVAKMNNGTNSFTYQKASDSDYRNQSAPRIKIDSTDKIHLIWNDNRINKGYGSIGYTYSTDNGNTYKPNIILDPNGNISNGNLAVTTKKVDIVGSNYNASPIETKYYKISF